MTITYLTQDEETEKRNKKIDCMVWLLERMRRRAAGRERMKMAERKRRIREAKRGYGFEVKTTRKPMGLVDDAEYGEALHLGCRPWVKA